MLKFKQITKIICFSLIFQLTGCASVGNTLKETFNSDDPCSNNARNIGIVAGAVGGAVIGSAIGDKKTGAIVGGLAVGALLGGFIGNDIDRRRCEIHKLAKKYDLEIETNYLTVNTQDNSSQGLSANISTDSVELFEPNSKTPTAKGRKVFSEIADSYKLKSNNFDLSKMTDKEKKETMQSIEKRNKEIQILLIGHTDDVGNTEQNAQLSEQRAKEIAKIFNKKGFSKSQIYYQGAGESFPIADNKTEKGRRKNRRVEVVDISNNQGFDEFILKRKPNTDFYRNDKDDKQVIAKKDTIKKSTKFGKYTKKENNSNTKKANEQSSEQKYEVQNNKENNKEKVITNNSNFIDFGGKIYNKNNSITLKQGDSFFGFIKSSHAATDIPICPNDHYRANKGVKSLQTEKLKMSQYFNNMKKGSAWSNIVNGHLVRLNNVSILRDGYATQNPTLLVYKDYEKGKKQTAASIKTVAKVNTYLGSENLLYRIFVEKESIKCIDVLIDTKSMSSKSNISNIYYIKDNDKYQAPYFPQFYQ